MNSASPGDLCRGRVLIAQSISSIVNGWERDSDRSSEIEGRLIEAKKSVGLGVRGLFLRLYKDA